MEGKTVVVFEELYQKDQKLAVHADIEDEEQTIHFPKIGTTARDAETGDKIANADKKVTLIDTVSYENLIPGEEYKISGILMDKGTKKAVEAEGRPVTAETVFTPKEASGSAEVAFHFDGSALKGKTVVAFESLTYDGKELAEHADLTYEGQTIRFPEIGTTAADSETGDHISKADEEVTVVDTVKYKNLLPGKEYKVSGVLMDKETGKELLVNGQKVAAETAFVPEKPEGSVDVVFIFDGSALKGKAAVAFETVTYQEKEVASHAEIKDEEQTVYFPEIGTTAVDSETGKHISKADGEVTIVDSVKYKNLIPGKEYKVTGILMDKETGEELLTGAPEDMEGETAVKGEKVTAETTFTPKKSSGSVDVVFTFDGSALKGKAVTAFETVTYQGKEVAVHAEIEDERQTVYFPEIGTTAKDSETEDHISNADQEVTLVDTVEYKNLIPGEEYKVTGTLMDKATEKAVEIDGKPVTAESVFVPEEMTGTVDVTFTFDGTDLKGKTVVAFESVSMEEKELAAHADLADEGQTIYFPEIGTTAADSETGCHVAKADEEVTVTDTVEYKNLMPGKEYKVTGVLMDKETGKELLVKDKKVIAEAIFVPAEPDGSIEMVFIFDGSALKGNAVVAFETVTYQEKEVASHTEIEDEGQTVHFPEVHTTAKDGSDGDKELLAGDTLTIVDTVEYRHLEVGQGYRVIGVLMDKSTGKALEIDGQPITAEGAFKAEKADGTIDVTFTFNGSALADHELVVFEKLYLEKDENKTEITSHEDLEDEGQTVKIVRPETPKAGAPKTGDHSKIWLWLALAGMSVLGIATVRIHAGRNKRKKA